MAYNYNPLSKYLTDSEKENDRQNSILKKYQTSSMFKFQPSFNGTNSIENQLNKYSQSETVEKEKTDEKNIPLSKYPDTKADDEKKWYDERKEIADAAAQKQYENTASSLEAYRTAAQELAEKNYAQQMEMLERNRKAQERNEAIEYEKLKKYLPKYIEQQGLSGIGVADSTILKAKDDYTNALGDIARDYNDAKYGYDAEKQSSDYETLLRYQDALSTAQSERDTALANNELSRYDSAKPDSDQKQEEAYNRVMNVILGESSIETAADRRAYFEAVKDQLSPTQRDYAEKQLAAIEASPIQKSADDEYALQNRITAALKDKKAQGNDGNEYTIGDKLSADPDKSFKTAFKEKYGAEYGSEEGAVLPENFDVVGGYIYINGTFYRAESVVTAANGAIAGAKKALEMYLKAK